MPRRLSSSRRDNHYYQRPKTPSEFGDMRIKQLFPIAVSSFLEKNMCIFVTEIYSLCTFTQQIYIYLYDIRDDTRRECDGSSRLCHVFQEAYVY